MQNEDKPIKILYSRYITGSLLEFSQGELRFLEENVSDIEEAKVFIDNLHKSRLGICLFVIDTIFGGCNDLFRTNCVKKEVLDNIISKYAE